MVEVGRFLSTVSHSAPARFGRVVSILSPLVVESTGAASDVYQRANLMFNKFTSIYGVPLPHLNVPPPGVTSNGVGSSLLMLAVVLYTERHTFSAVGRNAASRLRHGHRASERNTTS